jgi:predicted metal-dependent peptidase
VLVRKNFLNLEDSFGFETSNEMNFFGYKLVKKLEMVKAVGLVTARF